MYAPMNPVPNQANIPYAPQAAPNYGPAPAPTPSMYPGQPGMPGQPMQSNGVGYAIGGFFGLLYKLLAGNINYSQNALHCANNAPAASPGDLLLAAPGQVKTPPYAPPGAIPSQPGVHPGVQYVALPRQAALFAQQQGIYP